MESVLISIQPKWCELIASRKKTIEVRKSAPKLETPFRVYIYCTISGGIKGDYLPDSGLVCGKVIGEFICDRIEDFTTDYRRDNTQIDRIIEESCLNFDELARYDNGKCLYGWHISDLKIYDKPKELREFKNLKGEPIKNAYQSWGYINE